MVGNGNGIARGDNDDNREFYYYLSAGQVFGGKGPRREDWKVYAWFQDGERTIFDSGSNTEAEFDRERWGLGATFRKGKFRVYGEYVEADGMIPNATTGAAADTGSTNPNAFGPMMGAANPVGSVVSTFNTLTKNEAQGWYLDFGYKVLPNLELDVRYDELDRGTEGAASIERDFERWTIGAQYFFNKKSRFTLNYEFRDTEAPGGNAGQKAIVGGADDLLTAQVLVIF
jgi:phosphate-selective porin